MTWDFSHFLLTVHYVFTQLLDLQMRSPLSSKLPIPQPKVYYLANTSETSSIPFINFLLELFVAQIICCLWFSNSTMGSLVGLEKMFQTFK